MDGNGNCDSGAKEKTRQVCARCRGVGLQAEQRQAFGRLSACARRWWELGPGEFGAIKTKRRTMVIRLRLLPDAGFQRVI